MNKDHYNQEKLPPAQALRAYCTQCLGLNRWNREAVEDCQGDRAANGACPFYPFRMGRRISIKAFRAYCIYCAGGDRKYIRECPATTCPCYPYRLGKNPTMTGRKPSGATLDALENSRQKTRGQGKID